MDELQIILLVLFLLAGALSPLIRAAAAYFARRRAAALSDRSSRRREKPAEAGSFEGGRRNTASGVSGPAPAQPAQEAPLPRQRHAPPELVVLDGRGAAKTPPKAGAAGDRALPGPRARDSAARTAPGRPPSEDAFEPMSAGVLAEGSPAAPSIARKREIAKRLSLLLSNRRSLRDAFLLSEILSPPLALRKSGK